MGLQADGNKEVGPQEAAPLVGHLITSEVVGYTMVSVHCIVALCVSNSY